MTSYRITFPQFNDWTCQPYGILVDLINGNTSHQCSLMMFRTLLPVLLGMAFCHLACQQHEFQGEIVTRPVSLTERNAVKVYEARIQTATTHGIQAYYIHNNAPNQVFTFVVKISDFDHETDSLIFSETQNFSVLPGDEVFLGISPHYGEDPYDVSTIRKEEPPTQYRTFEVVGEVTHNE